MAKDGIGTFNKSRRGDYWLGRCDKCQETNLEKYKRCVNCFKGVIPPKTPNNTQTYDRSNVGKVEGRKEGESYTK